MTGNRFSNIGPSIRSKLLAPLTDLILPHRCIACSRILATKGAMCTDCWNGITFIGDPQCLCCGYPFELAEAREVHCNDCLAERPAYDHARSAFLYDSFSRDPLLAYKHADRTDLAPHLAQWLARPLRALPGPPDLILPVPLHRRRLFQRRYNQAALLAANITKTADIPCDMGLLRRVRATASQGHLSPGQRRRNIRGAFALAAGREAEVEGKSILLVDDVLTTGATVNECARLLKRQGAASVSVITLARATHAVSA